MRAGKILLFVGAAVAAVLIGLGIGYWSFGRPPAAPDTGALLLHPPKPLPAFSLVSDNQSPFTVTSLRGHWSLLYFGYTRCPDVCPTTLADLGKLLAQLRGLPAAEQPRVYFISVDPKRDRPARLREYVRYFNPAFTGVTGPVDQLHILAQPLGVAFSYQPPDQSGNYSVDHSAVVFLINPQAEEAAIFTPPMMPIRMAGDYRVIINRHGDH